MLEVVVMLMLEVVVRLAAVAAAVVAGWDHTGSHPTDLE